MNLAYLAMIERLQAPDKEHEDPRGELDAQLDITSWVTPLTKKYDESEVPIDAPSWWHGEEEASQSFFKSMGIDPSKLSG